MTHMPPTTITPSDLAPSQPDQPPAPFGHRLCPLALPELLALDLKPRGMVLEPIIPEKGLAMLYASRGTGKTHVALGIAYAVATGSRFLKWQAPRARRVLLIDGEMPAVALRERLLRISGGETPKPATLEVIAGDLTEHGIGNLASPAVQAELNPWLAGVELLILDNLSSLTTTLSENDADGWSVIQQWLLQLRRRGVSVLIVHHAGKGGEQRGTSRREDVLDTSIALRRPSDYLPGQGARFEVHIDKARGIHGDAAKPFEARLDLSGAHAVWTVKEIEDLDRQRVAALLAAGLSVREIADELDLSKSTVHRLKQRIEQDAAEAGEGSSQLSHCPSP
jgi:putative DNA primase/helicase